MDLGDDWPWHVKKPEKKDAAFYRFGPVNAG
jgi:hypothetical protein